MNYSVINLTQVADCNVLLSWAARETLRSFHGNTLRSDLNFTCCAKSPDFALILTPVAARGIKFRKVRRLCGAWETLRSRCSDFRKWKQPNVFLNSPFNNQHLTVKNHSTKIHHENDLHFHQTLPTSFTIPNWVRRIFTTNENDRNRFEDLLVQNLESRFCGPQWRKELFPLPVQNQDGVQTRLYFFRNAHQAKIHQRQLEIQL